MEKKRDLIGVTAAVLAFGLLCFGGAVFFFPEKMDKVKRKLDADRALIEKTDSGLSAIGRIPPGTKAEK